MPARETRPNVGLIPTSEHAAAGQTIEPSVSVPTPTTAKFAAIGATGALRLPLGIELSGDAECVGIGLDDGAQRRAPAVQVVDAGQIVFAQGVGGVLAALYPPREIRKSRLLKRERRDRRTGQTARR